MLKKLAYTDKLQVKYYVFAPPDSKFSNSLTKKNKKTIKFAHTYISTISNSKAKITVCIALDW